MAYRDHTKRELQELRRDVKALADALEAVLEMMDEEGGPKTAAIQTNEFVNRGLGPARALARHIAKLMGFWRSGPVENQGKRPEGRWMEET